MVYFDSSWCCCHRQPLILNKILRAHCSYVTNLFPLLHVPLPAYEDSFELPFRYFAWHLKFDQLPVSAFDFFSAFAGASDPVWPLPVFAAVDSVVGSAVDSVDFVAAAVDFVFADLSSDPVFDLYFVVSVVAAVLILLGPFADYIVYLHHLDSSEAIAYTH